MDELIEFVVEIICEIFCSFPWWFNLAVLAALLGAAILVIYYM